MLFLEEEKYWGAWIGPMLSWKQKANYPKRVRDRAKNIANDLGVSEKLSKLVGQRSQADRKLIYGLTLATVLIIVLCYVYVRRNES